MEFLNRLLGILAREFLLLAVQLARNLMDLKVNVSLITVIFR